MRTATALLIVLLPTAGPAAARGEDPDWPCVQRLVPRLTAAGVWSGPPLPGSAAWRENPAVVELVGRITPRAVTEEVGARTIEGFAAPLGGASRVQMLPLLMAGVLDETNRTRDELIERLKTFAHRQRDLAELVNRMGAELDSIPADATAEAGERRAELAQRHFWAGKAFQDAQRTLRYACDAPVRLEARFGAYARAIQDALPEGTR